MNVKNKLITILIFTIFIISITFAGCVEEGNSNDNNDILIVQEGDFVKINYVARYNSNGTMFDTSDEELAKKYFIFDSTKDYGPLKIFINPNGTLRNPSGFETYTSNPIPDFINQIIGMKKNEIKNFTMIYDEAYKLWDVELAEYYNISPLVVDEYIKKNRVMDKSNFSILFENVSVIKGTEFDWGLIMVNKPDIISAEIKNVTGDEVEFMIKPIYGSTFNLPLYNWTVNVTDVNETHFKFHKNADIGYYVVLSSESGDLNLKVVDKNETHFTIGLNTDKIDLNQITQEVFFAVEVLDIIRF